MSDIIGATQRMLYRSLFPRGKLLQYYMTMIHRYMIGTVVPFDDVTVFDCFTRVVHRSSDLPRKDSFLAFDTVLPQHVP